MARITGEVPTGREAKAIKKMQDISNTTEGRNLFKELFNQKGDVTFASFLDSKGIKFA